jgi:hypothetical protein
VTENQKVEPIRRRLHFVTVSGGDRPRGSSLTPRLALRSIDARKDFVFWSTANARAGRLRRPDRPRETERSLAPDRRQQLLPSAVIASDARKSLSVIEFRQVRRQPVSAFNSRVNSAPQRKIVSPQWDSRTRPAKRQHHRCIGCEKTLLLFPGPFACSCCLPISCHSLLFERLKSQAFAV